VNVVLARQKVFRRETLSPTYHSSLLQYPFSISAIVGVCLEAGI